jgi:PIN domain nuclease of toxin-antitoxin system
MFHPELSRHVGVRRAKYQSSPTWACLALPISPIIALQTSELPASYPKDPADRIIGATALIEDLPLVTTDTQIRKCRVFPTIW